MREFRFSHQNLVEGSMEQGERSTTGPHPLRLSLLQGFELCGRDDNIIRVELSAQRLVAFVALHERPVRRTYVSGMLWMDAPQRRANSSLRSALWRTPSPDGISLIGASNTHLWLNPEIEVDFRLQVSRAVGILERSAEDQLEEWETDTGSFREDLLPDWYEEWVLVERERFRQLRLHALERICERLADSGQYGKALEAGMAAVACEPLRESAQRQVIRVHLREGNLAEGLRQYRSFARFLANELKAQPSRGLRDLLASAGAPVEANLACVSSVTES